MKRTKSFFLVFIVSLVFLAACGNNAASIGDGEVQAQEGGEVVFVVMSDAPSLDPHRSNDLVTTNAASQIFERLTDFAEDGTVVPQLAESFEAIDDYTWEFRLHEGVTFHDGTEFHAEAVKVSFDRLLCPELASPRAVIFNMISEVNVIDEHTVHFVTEFPFSPLPAHLAHNGGSIIAPSAIEEENDGGRTVDENPIGTGPFQLESWNRGAQINFERFDDYWGIPANIDSLVFKVVGEPATRIAMLESGQAHAVIVAPADPANVALIEAMDHVEVDRIHSTRKKYIGFNTQSEPFNNVKVRQAISMAINKEDIVDGIVDGQAVPARGPLSPMVIGSTQDLETLDFDVETARALLVEAGFPDGFETTITVTEGDAAFASIAELVQANLREIGITVKIESVEWGALLEKTTAGLHEMFMLGWTTITADADYGLYPIFHSSMIGDPGNRTFFSNERVDELLELGRRTVDQEERNEIYAEISQILVYETPMIYLYYPDFVTGRNGIDGLFQNFNGTPFFHHVTLIR